MEPKVYVNPLRALVAEWGRGGGLKKEEDLKHNTRSIEKRKIHSRGTGNPKFKKTEDVFAKSQGPVTYNTPLQEEHPRPGPRGTEREKILSWKFKKIQVEKITLSQ